MHIGLKQGVTGADVERLHRILQAAALEVDAGEVGQQVFGPSTEAALRTLQTRHGIRARGEVDEDTLKILRALERQITINVYESGAPASAPVADELQGSVSGKLVDEDGAGIAGTAVALYVQGLRSRSELGTAQTGSSGAYRISYRRPTSLNLLVQANGADGALIAQSAVVFSAAAEVEIDLTTAKDGVVRGPSAFTNLTAAVSSQLGATPLQDLKENKDNHELEFVANAIGAALSDVAQLYIARCLSISSGLKDATLYGIFSQGIPGSLASTLSDLPDTGIDAAFTAQVLSDVLAHSRSALSSALAAALAANVLPASYAAQQDAELSHLDALRVQSVGAAAYLGSGASLNDLLAAGNVDQSTRSAFTRAYAASGARLDATWAALQADKNVTPAQLATLGTTLSAGELLAGNLPLVKDTLQRLLQGTLTSVQNLALLDATDWAARIQQVDPQATSIASSSANDTPQRIATFSKALADGIAVRYPTTAFLGGLQKAQSSSFKARSELIQVLTAHPDIDLSAAVLDQYVATNQLKLSATALSDLKTVQRLQRLSPGYASVEALNAAGYQSAQAIYVRGRAPFVAQMSPLLGGAPVADAVWAQAQSGYASALAAYARFNLALNGTTVALMASPTPPAAALANLPDLQVLFGSLDFCECSDCRSILSPAAYLVDLLQFLKQRAATGGFSSARGALLSRRPDLQYIALGCQNTNVTLPYIDVVNELLEAVIVPPTTPVTLIETTGTSAERRALPQSVSQAAYGKTAGAVFPLPLPFDLPFAQTSAFLQGLGTSLAEVMLLCGTGTAAARAAARLELNPALQSVINGSDTHQVWERWGFTSANPTSVVDPKTRQAMLVPGTTTVLVPSDWIDALSHVPVLLGRAQLTFAQLCQLLEVVWVTADAVTLKLGAAAPSPSSVPVVSCDTELMSLTGLDANGFDRVSRFLRLLDVTGLQMWELDWALTAAGSTLDDTFLVFLGGALALRDQLSLPLQELLAFWGPLPTRDVTSHLGDSDVVVPSTYSSVFRSPTLLASWPGVFVDAGSLSGGTIIVPTTPPPTPAQLANQNAVKAALGLGADDIAAILTATAAANALSLDTLLALFRHARMASSLSLSVPDLLLWIVLTDIKPFGGSPADTTEFLRRMALLQATGIPLHDLDYLLRNASVSQTALAFTSVQMTTLLQTLRDALAKLTPAAQADAPTVATIVVGALSTAIGVSATIVTPVLARTGVLPLAPSVVAQLLAQTSGVDPSLFPQLVAAFTRVAKAAALFNALRPTEIEFAFLVQNASVFNWLDPSALPLTAPASSPYQLFERLLYALQLNHRQSARSPKLFDVLGGWSVALPADVAGAITGNSGALALALNASVADLSTLVTSLGATTPVLTSATQAGSLADMVTLMGATTALDALTQYRIGAGTLVQLASAPPTADSAAAAMAVYQARYTSGAWFAAVQPIEDTLRQMRRDALVAYVIGQGTANTVSPPLLSSDDIFDYYLIDPEMCACGMTTRLLEASLAVQQFVQQCFLGLVPTVSVDAATDSGWDQWSWMSQFRLWQANREVFLYPENYLLPELRTDKSPFFVDLENDLKQSNCDADAVTAAFENYLRKLVAVRNLVVAAHYNEIRADGSQVVHVFARTRGTPPQWYYRTRTQRSIGAGIWSAWQALNLDIASEQAMPVVWDQRLHLVWPIFKQISEKAAEQNVPASGGGAPSQPPRKIWTIEFARSELSAGQWQAKSIYDEKLYFDLEGPTAAFTFHAFADATFSLQLQVYYNARDVYQPVGPLLFLPKPSSFNELVGTGTLSMPDSPILVSEVTPPCPDISLIDLSQEPSFARITALNKKITISLPCPTGYQYSAQDLLSSAGAEFTFTGLPPAPVPLYVLARGGSPYPAVTASGKPPTVSVELLAQILSPRIVVPQQEPAFDSADPFFVADLSRTYFVRPYSHLARLRATDTSTSLLGRIAEIAPYQWETNYTFETFHHPFARTFLRELEIGGPDQLMQRELQIAPLDVRGQGDYVFAALYLPQPPVNQPYPVEDVDFSVSGANSLYNWELFYHAPMFVASQLMRNQQYQDAMQWLEYVFDPTDPSSTPVPGHFWRTRPFYELNLTSGGVNEWLAQQIESILTTLAADAQEGVSDPDTAAAIADWVANPFDPHRVARLRITAYAKATVMKFLDNLIAWGDSLYAQYTMEMVAQAEQLYVFADLILGPQPDQVRLPDKDLATSPDATSYAAIEAGLDAFSNELVAIENVIAAPTSSVVASSAGNPAASLPQLWTLFFCIPPNDQLLAYWSTIADRLYKIRHCLNLQGVAQPLPLYAPPINPLQLIEQAAGGGAGGIGTLAFTPIYRFAVYLERALELTNDVRAYGSLVLAALEKKDAEALGVLKASQDVDIQTRLLDIKTKSATEAQDQITALQNQKAVVQIRFDFYKNIAFMNDWETAAIVLQGTAAIANGLALVSDLLSGTAALIPTVTFGASGFGGSPTVTASIGGQAAAQSSSSFASASRGLASLLSEAGGLSATMGGYNRRQDEWTLQLNLATAELTQVDSQIAAATDRLAVANAEVDLQSRQIDNAQAVSDFLTSKYTSGQLYDWMLSQLTTVHTQAYQMAFSLAQQAQAAYQYELGSQDSFVQFGYWNSQYKGLTAGESLLFDLRRMQAQYLAANTREFELVKHVSLALTQPMALVQLLQTGTCNIALDEALFDLDHPGHYFRRLRSVALTIPCVTGPYAGVNATLALNTATVRVQPPIATYTPASAMAPPATAAFVTSPAAAAASISTSHGQNDAGLFDVNLRDERWLPFEGQGAISTWTLVLDPRDNSFDLSTIIDVVLQLRYTARSAGGDPQAVRQALKKLLAADARQIMLSVRSSFSDAYYAFFNPADTTATQQTLVLPLLPNVLPFSNLGTTEITDIAVYFVFDTAPAASTVMSASFGPTGGSAGPLSIVPVPGSTGGGTPIAAMGADVGLTAPSSPDSFSLTVPESSVPAALGVTTNGHLRLDATKFQDIVLVVSYKVV
ncbi:MAG TPA: neuraminidase-like domain-containing protein [Steroidobacteraceae bacterium]|jgi:hypothetical protein